MCFQAVPNEASKLIEFQDVVRSTVEFENKLRTMMFLSPDRKDGKLTQFVDDVEVHFAVRKRSEILVKARNILVQYDYDSRLVSVTQEFPCTMWVHFFHTYKEACYCRNLVTKVILLLIYFFSQRSVLHLNQHL